MRITVVSAYFASHRGGIEIVAEHIARTLAHEHGHTIDWVASATPAPDSAPPDGVHYLPIAALNTIERLTGLPLPIWGPIGLTRLYRAIRGGDVLLLHDTLYPGNIVAYIFAKLLRRPILVIQHIGLVPYRNPIARICMRLGTALAVRPMLRYAERTVFISATVQSFFRKSVTFRRPDTLVFNGVDVDTFHPCPDSERVALRTELEIDVDAPVLLFVGRFVEKKGLAVLHRLATRMPDITWVFAGWGPLDPSDWQLENVRVMRDLAGQCLASWYRVADILVLPSVGEGFPLVVQEAMACGTPVLCGSEAAQADPKAARFLNAAAVDERNPDATAQLWHGRLLELIEDLEALRTQRQPIAEFARARWSWSAAADAYAAILRDCCIEHRPARRAEADERDVAM